MLLLNGAALSNFSIYNNLDYLVQINAPFVEREKRVNNRDGIVIKGMMVRRDREFRDSIRRAKKRGRQIDIKIENTGTVENLQQIADEFYDKHISNKPLQSMKQKYGGYKTINVRETRLINKKETEQEIQK